MIKLFTFLVLCTSVYSETTDELKIRFMKEIEICDDLLFKGDRSTACHLSIANKLYLLVLIEQMKSNGSK